MGLAESLLNLEVFTPIKVSAWPDKILTIRQISGLERQKIVEATETDQTKSRSLLLATGVALFLGDQAGVRVFSDDQIKDVQNLPGLVQHEIFAAGTEYNQLRKDDVEGAKKN